MSAFYSPGRLQVSLLIAGLFIGGQAHAQPAPEEGSPSGETTAEEQVKVEANPADESTDPLVPDPVEPEKDPDSKAVQQLFQKGLQAIKTGDFEEAAALFEEVARQSQLAERKETATSLSAYAKRLNGLTQDDPVAMEALSSGRVEFIVTSTLIGAYSGVVVLDVAELGDVRLGAAVVLLTTGGALTGALFGTRGVGIRAAEGSAYSSGALWGGTTALLTALSLDLGPSEAYQLSTLTGLVGGAFGGFFLARGTQATAGQVSIMTNGGTLGFTTSALSLAYFSDLEFNNSLYLLGGLQVGTGVGAWLAYGSDWSASRAALSLTGGGVGALTLWATTALITGGDNSMFNDETTLMRVWLTSSIVGLWGGYGLTAWLTDGMEADPEYEASLSSLQLMPWVTPESKGIGLVGTF